jgi:hypothetical protein
MADPTTCDAIRDTLRSLTARRAGRLHWREEDRRRRDHIAATIAALDIAAIAVIGSPVDNARQERARRCCLERLLFELGDAGVSHSWLEARTPSLNRRDTRFVDTARDRELLPAEMRVGFVQPTEEPMLWLPDAVAGAVTGTELGHPRWLEMMRSVVQTVDVLVR